MKITIRTSQFSETVYSFTEKCVHTVCCFVLLANKFGCFYSEEKTYHWLEKKFGISDQQQLPKKNTLCVLREKLLVETKNEKYLKQFKQQHCIVRLALEFTAARIQPAEKPSVCVIPVEIEREKIKKIKTKKKNSEPFVLKRCDTI